jgi:Arylsulfotransferase (ASST)
MAPKAGEEGGDLMIRRFFARAICALVLGPSILFAFPSVYPTGTTIYRPDKAWNGYTLHPNPEGAILIDMNGNMVKQWKGLDGRGGSGPYRILPGGFAMGSRGARGAPHQDVIELVQLDWDGRVIWKFDRYEEVRDPGKESIWMARQHHDYQREGNPVGYYVPGLDPLVDRGQTLILSHKNLSNPKITDKLLVDDVIYEVTWEGEIVWEWLFSDHFDELGFSEEAKNTLYRHPGWNEQRGSADWLHINSMSTLGPNKWHDAGDPRFHPDNIIWSARAANIIGITDKKTGKIVWRVGPDYTVTPALRALGQIVGQHHPHMIPKGLPGEGNILVFDNGGGPAGYGAPNPMSVTGERNAQRDYSRVVEFDPVTLAIAWEYSPATIGYQTPQHAYRFYSGFISSAQRLLNANTLITEGANGRVFEVTGEREIVWEYVSPFFYTPNPRFKPTQQIYRAYRVPYDWVPQLPQPVEKAVVPPDNSKFRINP